MKARRGMALLFALSVGAILSILAVSLLSLYYGDYHSQRVQQFAIQAYWNARAGLERYAETRQLPEKRLYDFGSNGVCQVSVDHQDLIFEGRSGSVTRTFRLISGDPAQKVEIP